MARVRSRAATDVPRGGATGEAEYQPVLGDALHPGPGVGDEVTRREQPDVPDPQGAEGPTGLAWLGGR